MCMGTTVAFVLRIINDATVLPGVGGRRTTRENEDTVTLAQPLQYLLHTLHVGSLGLVSAVHVYFDFVRPHAAYAVQKLIDDDANVASDPHGNVSKHQPVGHTVGVVGHDDARPFFRYVFQPFQIVEQVEILACQLEKVLLAPVVPILFNMGVSHIESMEPEKFFSEVDEPFRPDFPGGNIVPQINHFLSFFHVVQS